MPCMEKWTPMVFYTLTVKGLSVLQGMYCIILMVCCNILCFIYSYIFSFPTYRLLEIAVQKFGIDSDSQTESLLSKIHIWRPENLQDILNK